MDVSKAYIHSVVGDKVYFTISLDNKGQISSAKQSVQLSKITFKNQPAPRSLIIPNALIYCKKGDRGLYEVYLDPDLIITIKLGYIEHIDNQIVGINDYNFAEGVPITKIVSNSGQNLPIDKIRNSIGSPVMIYFNADAIIECKLVETSTSMNLNLDAFTIINSQMVSEYFCFKDARLIQHRLYKDNVFYKDTDKKFPAGAVSSNMGAPVRIILNNNRFIAYVDVKCPVEEMKKSKDDNEMNRKSLINTTTYNARMGNRTQPLFPNQSLNPSSTITPIPPTFQNPKKYGKRIFDHQLNYYAKVNDNLKSNILVLLTLLEVQFRFNDHPITNNLYRQLYFQAQKLGNPGIETILNQLFQIKRVPNEKGKIEKIYEIVHSNLMIFEALIGDFIQDPPNFDELSENFQVVFGVTDKSAWTMHYPFACQGHLFPLIMIVTKPVFQIIYSKEMMIYDGYDPNNCEYSIPGNIDPAQLKYPIGQQTPDFYQLLQSILEFQQFTSELASKREKEFYEIAKKVNNNLKTFASIGGAENFEAFSGLYKKIRDIKVKENTCNCGKETSGKYYCANNHSLCSSCALGSCRIGKCFYCEDINVAFDLRGENYTCCACQNSYDPMYFFSLECTCVYCTGCGYQLFCNQKYCNYHNKPVEDKVIMSVYGYMQKFLGYS